MQGVASLVLMPHKTTDTRSSVSSASTEVGTREKSSVALSSPSETKEKEDKQTHTCPQHPGTNSADDGKSSCSKPPATNIRDLFLSFDKAYNLDQAFKQDNLLESPVPIVLSSSHASAAQKSTCLVQDGDRYIFLVEDNRSSKASSLCQGSGARNAKPSDEVSENPEQDEEGEDTEVSDGGSEASLEDVRQHHGIIKTQKQDDPDYLTLFEAHQRRLEDVGSQAPDRPMATTQPQPTNYAPNFDSVDAKSQATSGNVVSTPQAFTQQVATGAAAISHDIVVTSQNIVPSPQHTSLPANAVTLTVQPAQIQTPQTALITANVITSDGFQTKEGFPTTEEQYVEALSAEHAIYPNGTAGNAYHYTDATIFGQQATSSYLEASQQQNLISAAATTPGSVPSGQTYLQVTQGGTTIQTQRHPMTHTTRASPATVQWLVDNYETAEGVSLPRSTLYNHYLQHCQSNKLDAVNAASFGKLIRSVFMGLRTRRLGTRGNSKYHYYGIRIKPSSPLNALSDDAQVAMRQSPSTQKRLKPAARLASDESGDTASHSPAMTADQQAQQSQMQQHQQYLGDVTQGLPEFEELDLKGVPLPEGITDHDLDTFVDMYREHCEAFLDVVVNLQFTLVESLWQTFWRHPAGNDKSGADDDDKKDVGDDGEYESRLSQSKLTQLCEFDPVITFVKACDHLLYQTLVEILIPDVLRPIPASLTQAVRNFAKGLEGWLVNSLDQIPKKMADVKVTTCSAFAQTLRRYTSLNHLAQAARAVLQNSSQISQMLADLNRVDFANVQEQASWVCQCDDHVVYRLEQDFKLTLQQQNSLEQWATWLEGVVDQVLKQHEGTDEFPKAARQFLLKWSFYSSMIIRDLTLRSAASFGSFHLIRLLYDEYMFYLVEHKVAKAIGASPMAVMGEFVGLGSALSMGLDSVENSLLSEQPDCPLNYDTQATGSSTSSSTTRPLVTGSLEPEAKRPRPS